LSLCGDEAGNPRGWAKGISNKTLFRLALLILPIDIILYFIAIEAWAVVSPGN
jgi:hypothetical protein